MLASGLDQPAGIAQTGGVDQDDRIAAEVEMNLDRVAGGAGYGRDNCDVAAGQGIDQARLSGIGRADHGDGQAVAQALAPVPIGKVFRNRRP